MEFFVVLIVLIVISVLFGVQPDGFCFISVAGVLGFALRIYSLEEDKKQERENLQATIKKTRKNMKKIETIPDITFSDVRKYVDLNNPLGRFHAKTSQHDDFVKRIVEQLNRSKEYTLWFTYLPVSLNGKQLPEGVLVATITRFLFYIPEKRTFVEKIAGKPVKTSRRVIFPTYENMLWNSDVRDFSVTETSAIYDIAISVDDRNLNLEIVIAISDRASVLEKKRINLQTLERLLQLTISAKSLEEVEKTKQERMDAKEKKRIVKEKNERERKINMDKLLISWEPDDWQDKTKSVIRTSAELWGSYDAIHEKWNNKPMKLGFSEEENKYWINVDYSFRDSILSPLEKEMAYSVTVDITNENRWIKLFYYEKNWYYIQADISFDDAVALIAAEELRKKQKIEQEKQNLKREIEQAKSLLNGEDVERRRKNIPKDVQKIVWNRDEGKCVECGSNEKLEFDHIIPFSKGGSNTARNLQLLCETCNRKKSNNIG